MDFKNQNVIIVGASSGIGLAIAKLLYDKGATVILVGRDSVKLKNSLQKIKKADDERIRIISADMTKEEDRELIISSTNVLDHLIVTAANLTYSPIKDYSYESIIQAVQSKIIAPFFLTQKAMNILRSSGSITFISGIAAERPMVGGVVTGTVNGALNSMVRGLAVELAPIRVNAISPGWIDTPIWEMIMNEEQKIEKFDAMKEKIPVRRIGKPEDVAQLVVSTISNGFISGSVLYVDGGQRII